MFFGILHCITLSSVLALPFLRAPVIVAIGAAAACLAAPLLLTSPAFNAPALAFLGLGTAIPVTNDYVPLFPWFGFVLAGIALMRILGLPVARDPARIAAYPAPMRALAFAGRHSLIIYLVHQPLIFGAMSGWVAWVGPNPTAEAAPFLGRCEASCRTGTESAAICLAACTCAIDTFKAENLWGNILRDQASPEERMRIGSVARVCFDRSRGTATTPHAAPRSD